MDDSVSVPTGPIRRICDAWLAEHEQNLDGLSAYLGLDPKNVRDVYKIDRIRFDKADLFVTKLAGPLTWHTDPELSEAYMALDMASIDFAFPVSDSVREAYDDALRKWEREGLTFAQIAKKLGVSRGAIANRMRKGWAGVRSRECTICGKTFEANFKMSKSRTCGESSCRTKQEEIDREQRRIYRRELREKREHTHSRHVVPELNAHGKPRSFQCPECWGWFKPKTRAQKYCTSECQRQNAKKQRKRRRGSIWQ